MYLTLDTLLGVEKDFPERPSSTPIIERREIWNYMQKKKSITKIILEKRY
jgi:hypothetical protein